MNKPSDRRFAYLMLLPVLLFSQQVFEIDPNLPDTFMSRPMTFYSFDAIDLDTITVAVDSQFTVVYEYYIYGGTKTFHVSPSAFTVNDSNIVRILSTSFESHFLEDGVHYKDSIICIGVSPGSIAITTELGPPIIPVIVREEQNE